MGKRKREKENEKENEIKLPKYYTYNIYSQQLPAYFLAV